MSDFVLGWEETIPGNIKIIGRPFSKVSATKGYDKSLVKRQLALAVQCARQMALDTRDLVGRSITPALERTMEPGPLGFATTLSPLVQEAVIEHFKLAPLTAANAQSYVDLFQRLQQVYMMIQAGIGHNIEIVDIPSEVKHRANGAVNFSNARLLDPGDEDGPRMANRGRIHINFVSLTTRTPQLVARTIIHEASHKFTGMRDHAYISQRIAYRDLTPEKAQSNADSFACFAYDTWNNGAHALRRH